MVRAIAWGAALGTLVGGLSELVATMVFGLDDSSAIPIGVVLGFVEGALLGACAARLRSGRRVRLAASTAFAIVGAPVLLGTAVALLQRPAPGDFVLLVLGLALMVAPVIWLSLLLAAPAVVLAVLVLERRTRPST